MRIEGAALSDRDVERLLTVRNLPKGVPHDLGEAVGCYVPMERVLAHWQDLPLTEGHIKQLHRDLLQYSAKHGRQAGEYRTRHTRVDAIGLTGRPVGVVFETATPDDTPRMMAALVEWTRFRLDAQDLHPLIVIALFAAVLLDSLPDGPRVAKAGA